MLVIHHSVFLITACGRATYSLELLSAQSVSSQDVPYREKLQVLLASLLQPTAAMKCSELSGMSALFTSFLFDSNCEFPASVQQIICLLCI